MLSAVISGSHMRALYRRMMGSELANEDFFSIVKVLEREAGLREPPPA
jgi:hypothetical protein